MAEGTEETTILTDDVDLDISKGPEKGVPAVYVERVNPFSEKTKTNKTALVVEGEKLYVSKHVLSLVSPVFRAMFELDMEEKKMAEIPLPGKRLTDMAEFLLCVYPDTRKPITAANAATVAPLSDEYQVDYLKNRCERALTRSCTEGIDIDKIFENLLLASTYNMKTLKEKCIELASVKQSSTLKEAQIKYALPSNLKSELWERATDKRDIKLRAFNIMCQALPTKQVKQVEQKESSVKHRLSFGHPEPVTNTQRIVGQRRAFNVATSIDETTGDDYITAIQLAIRCGFVNILEILVGLYAAKLYCMEIEIYKEVKESGLPVSIQHKILHKIARQEPGKVHLIMDD